MKNSDLTTIIANVIISLALLAVMTVLLLQRIIDATGMSYFLIGVFALNGLTGALLAPSPKQMEQVASAIAASVPQVPLVSITHPASSAPDIQVSSAGLPKEPQPIMMPHAPAPPVYQQPPNFANATTGPWPVPQQPAPYQIDRNWTGLQPTVPPQQQQQ